MLDRKDWASLAARQRQTVFGPQVRQLSQKRMEAMLQSFDFMCELQPKKGSPAGQVRSAYPTLTKHICKVCLLRDEQICTGQLPVQVQCSAELSRQPCLQSQSPADAPTSEVLSAQSLRQGLRDWDS